MTTNEEKTIKVGGRTGSRFKDYTSFIVPGPDPAPPGRGFSLRRWLALDGTVLTALSPDGIDSHFGPELRRFILAQYHQGQVTVPRLVEM